MPYAILPKRQNTTKTARWSNRGALLLLLLFYWRVINAALAMSMTFDEGLHILYGVLYWRDSALYSVVQNPPLVNAFIGLLLNLSAPPVMPFDLPVWSSFDWWAISRAFLWESNDGLVLVALSRLAVVFLALLLGALLYRWGSELFQTRFAGLLALFLYTFDPNVIAHSALATNDLGVTFVMALAVYLAWRYWSMGRKTAVYLLAALAIGLAFSAKFTGFMLIPALGAMLLYWLLADHAGFGEWQRAALVVAGWLLLGLVILLVVYRGQVAILQADFTWQQTHQTTGHPAFFLGELSSEGWWAYFPVVFTIKTPLATLAMLGMGLLAAQRPLRQRAPLWLLLPGLLLFAAGMSGRVNVGYRYLLPALPLLFLLIGGLAATLYGRGLAGRWLVGGGLLWLAASSLLAHPHYLAYFNVLAAGGPDHAWRLVGDSNIDWGQDLPYLASYLAREDISAINLSFFGNAPPERYGITDYRLLPTGPVDWQKDIFYPERPLPGYYALSVTQLQGIYLPYPNWFDWFAARPPQGKAGYSLFIYQVLPDGPPVSLALSGLGLSQIAKSDWDPAFGSNNVRPIWFDARTALLWPGGHARGNEAAVWIAIAASQRPQHPALAELLNFSEVKGWKTAVRPPDKTQLYKLIHWPHLPSSQLLSPSSGRNLSHDFAWTLETTLSSLEWQAQPRLEPPILFDNTLELVAYEILPYHHPQSQNPLTVLTYWRIHRAPVAPLKLFLHLIDETGQLVAQHDGLDVQTDAILPGDEIIQLHTIWLSDLATGIYALQIGVYESETGARLPIQIGNVSGDRVLLTASMVKP